METNVWSFLVALAPAIIAGGAWIQAALNKRLSLEIKQTGEASHKLINQRFTELEAANAALIKRIERYEAQAVTVAGQAAAIADAAATARALLQTAAAEAVGTLAAERRRRS